MLEATRLDWVALPSPPDGCGAFYFRNQPPPEFGSLSSRSKKTAKYSNFRL